MNKNYFFTIAIISHEMRGLGHEHLSFLLLKLYEQSEKNFEIIISDHSKNNKIENIIKLWKSKLQIIYYRNLDKIGNPSSNLNNILRKKINGQYIKFFFLDDYPKNKDCLKLIKDHIIKKNYPAWILCGSDHSNDKKSFYNPIIPYYNKQIHLGKNTISSPSVLCIKSEGLIFFDENFKWLLDVVYYRDYFQKFGSPSIIKEILVTNGEGPNRLHHIMNDKEKFIEIIRSIKKYDNIFMSLIYIFQYNIKYVISKITGKKLY